MKPLKLLVAFFAMFLLLSPACNCGGESGLPRTGKVKIKPHNDLERADIYCNYKVTGPPSSGVAQLAVGNIICIVCPAGKQRCDNYTEVEMEDGAVYPVEALTNGLACTDCPRGTDNPPGFPFEER